MRSYLENLSDNIIIDKEKCIFCGKCVDSCVCDNLRLKLAPCRNACPLGVNCHGYVQLIARNEFDRALDLIEEDLPFPRVIGRICHHPCEEACERLKVDEHPVALRALKRFLADQFDSKIPEGNDNTSYRPEKIAVVGGGPAGATASYYLRCRGYSVDIFEAGSRLGGMTTSCVPEFRLPSEIALREYNKLEKMGVKINYNCKVGTNVSLKELMNEYHSVIISVGCQKSKQLGLEGEESPNVFQALDFLQSAKNMNTLKIGRRVVVIGGGNTAVDAAQTAYRLGADEVRIVCLEKREEMPIFIDELKDAMEEGIIIENGWGPDYFEIENNLVTGIHLKRCISVFDDKGGFQPIYENGEKRYFPVDTVIIAIGQEPDTAFQNSTKNEIDFSKVNPITLQIDSSKVFAAGDIVTGPKTVIDAMAQGRDVVESIDRFLKGQPMTYGRFCAEGFETDFPVDISKAESIPRVMPSKINLSSRRNFEEIEKTITKEQAIKESARCLSCGEPHGKFRNCWQCLACEVECPEQALYVEVPYLMK
ncbi:MAG: hypothetical protein B6I30_09790 [Desulfobacteraceae bacterium 4572_187]|nr:MAG: hypothetical protein B6I30_09790 [Desulfobacteraceae bacterium 4572_187]